ncbi:MAG: hypothetical protein QF464_03610 [Myxococcota bacterium]|nr:hypothetical protein [Myxococcota bacterium]
MDQRLTPNFLNAFIGPCFPAYSRISARCEGVYRFATRFGLVVGAVVDGGGNAIVTSFRFAFERQHDTVPSGMPRRRAASDAPTSAASSNASDFSAAAYRRELFFFTITHLIRDGDHPDACPGFLRRLRMVSV